jgi:hypothetical protein
MQNDPSNAYHRRNLREKPISFKRGLSSTESYGFIAAIVVVFTAGFWLGHPYIGAFLAAIIGLVAWLMAIYTIETTMVTDVTDKEREARTNAHCAYVQRDVEIMDKLPHVENPPFWLAEGPEGWQRTDREGYTPILELLLVGTSSAGATASEVVTVHFDNHVGGEHYVVQNAVDAAKAGIQGAVNRLRTELVIVSDVPPTSPLTTFASSLANEDSHHGADG